MGNDPSCPKLFELRTIPRPMWNCQIRLAITREVNRLLGSIIQSASTRRRPALGRSIQRLSMFWKTVSLNSGGADSVRCGNSGATSSVGECGFPRYSTKVCSGLASTFASPITDSRAGNSTRAFSVFANCSFSLPYCSHWSPERCFFSFALRTFFRTFGPPSVLRWSGPGIFAMPACSISCIEAFRRAISASLSAYC